MVPICISDLVAVSDVVGFSGSRSPSRESLMAVGAICCVFPPRPVLVGCARGVDAAVREIFPHAEVFAVRSGLWGFTRGSFAGRSAALVRALRDRGGCLLSFPSSECPTGLSPSSSSSRCFGGFGSGSWSSLAFALGLDVPCAVWLPSSVPCPSSWDLIEAGCGWWLSVPRSFVQLSLVS